MNRKHWEGNPMQGAGWKLTALAASLAVGFVVLMQVQQSLNQTQTPQASKGEEDPSQGDPSGQENTKQPTPDPVNLEEGNGPVVVADVNPFAANPNEQNAESDFKPDFELAGLPLQPAFEPNPPQPTFKPNPPQPVSTPNNSISDDPFAAFTKKLEQQAQERKANAGQNAVVNSGLDVDQWNSQVTQASGQADQGAPGKITLTAGGFPEAVPATETVNQPAFPPAEEKKTASQKLIELTLKQNLPNAFPAASTNEEAPKALKPTSGFPAPSTYESALSKQGSSPFPPAEPKKTEADTIRITPGTFPPASSGNDTALPIETKTALTIPQELAANDVPAALPGFPAPETATTNQTPKPTSTPEEKKPFFEGFPETTQKPSGNPDDPFRVVPEFNADKPAPQLKAEPKPSPFAPEEKPQDDPTPKSNPFPASPAPNSNPFPTSDPAPEAQPKPVPVAPETTTVPSSAPLSFPLSFPLMEENQKPQPDGLPISTSEPNAMPAPLNEPASESIGSARVDPKVPETVLQPNVKLFKSAPDKAVLGKPLIYSIEVENVGDVTVKQVIVEDLIPEGAELTGTIPRAELVDKTLVWNFDELKPGDRQKILVRIVPVKQGKIGSTSTVSYKSSIVAQTMITAPKLELILEADQQVAVGEMAQLHFVARNIGDGEARDVVLRNLIPTGFEHPAGTDLEYDLGTIKGGEEKEISLQLNAKVPGTYKNVASIRSGELYEAEATSSLQIIPAVLSVTRNSPSRRFVGHEMKQITTLKNNSLKSLKNVIITEHVSAGFEFRKASDRGQYSDASRTISWNINELPAGEELQISSTLSPTTIGTHAIKLKAMDASGHQAVLESSIKVEGFASLAVRVPDAHPPVSQGERVSMRFKVINRGTAEATRVIVNCKIPAQLEYVSANGPVKANHNGQFISFEPIRSLGPNQEASFDLVFSGLKSGNGNVEFEVASEQSSTPLKHHEQVVIFGD